MYNLSVIVQSLFSLPTNTIHPTPLQSCCLTHVYFSNNCHQYSSLHSKTIRLTDQSMANNHHQLKIYKQTLTMCTQILSISKSSDLKVLRNLYRLYSQLNPTKLFHANNSSELKSISFKFNQPLTKQTNLHSKMIYLVYYIAIKVKYYYFLSTN